jgi:hypothetical protein
VQLLTRTGLDWTEKYPGAIAALANLKRRLPDKVFADLWRHLEPLIRKQSRPLPFHRPRTPFGSPLNLFSGMAAKAKGIKTWQMC